MKYLKLPDLGEGLQEAEVVRWHVKPGDAVAVDQVVVSVETAKAIVEVPSPQAGTIAALFGEAGDILQVGEPLLEYVGEEAADAGTVVGEMPTTAGAPEVEHFIIGSAGGARPEAMATPAIRALARRLSVDLSKVTGSGRHGVITAADVERAAKLERDFGPATPLRGVQRAMARNMETAHREVARVTIHDDVDIHGWFGVDDVTMRLVRAIGAACKAEGRLNAWFDNAAPSLRLLGQVDLGIAVDTPDGLFVPVLRDIGGRSMEDLRSGLDRLRADVRARTIPPAEMIGATISLSNYGTLAGRYGNPIVVPPMVAILGAGRIRDEVVPCDGEVAVRPVLPLSLSFDHRAVTGGEAARFMKAVMEDLALKA